ncbi:MAG: hypothetical protein ACTSV7_00505, partial [Candidatus Baldrarchaeia archaeon]
MRKRGQVTLFIIVGLVIVILIGLYFTVKFLWLKKPEVAKPTIQPIKDTLDKCLQKVGEEAIILIGLQGGQIYKDQDPIPTSTQAPIPRLLEVVPGGPKVLVWYRHRGNGLEETNLPSTHSMEEEISKYVTQNFQRCVDKVFSHAEEFELKFPTNPPKVRTTIGKRKVNIVVTYPIEIKKEGSTFTLSNFRISIDSNLGYLFSLARELFEKENKDYLLENKTIDLMVSYDPEIPLTGIEINCEERVWFIPEVVSKLKRALYENFAVTKVKNTNFRQPDKRLSYLTLDMLKSKHKDVT